MTAQSRPVIGIAGWVLVSFAAAALGGVASANARDFYERLSRPAWAPPSFLFGPVWSVLYLLMGIAAGLVWRARGFDGARVALTLFIIQLGLNALWTWLFFAGRMGMWAFIEIVLLGMLILATIVAFGRAKAISAWLLLLYLAWVSYAAALSYAGWRLNPDVLG